MKPLLTTIRAIGAEFALRSLRPLVVCGSVVAILLLGLEIWLTAESAWGWLLLVPTLVLALFFTALAVAAYAGVRMVRPELDKQQRAAIIAFVDKLQRVAETLGIGRFALLYFIVRDTLRPRSDGFIATTISDSKTLSSDFLALQQLFR